MRQRDMVETVIRRDEVSRDNANYLYELTVRENKLTASYGIPLYSVSVAMRDTEGELTEASVKDAFADAGRAIVFYEKVVRYLATPIDLIYILEDEG